MMLEPFHQGRVVRTLLGLRVRHPLIPLGVFASYWVLPLIILVLTNEASVKTGWPTATGHYVRDLTHLLYSVLISLGALPIYLILKKTSPVVRHTLRIVKGRSDHEHWQRKYRAYQRAAFSRWLVFGCAILALFIFITLLFRVFDSGYQAWWGHISHGLAGVYFAVIVAQMVFWGTWSFLIVAAVSMVISHIARCKFSYEPLRADGCNGLRPVGLLIMLMWSYSLLASLAIYVVFSRGYLDLEDTPGIWLISLVASLCLPLVALLPLISVTRAIRHARELYLLDIERASRKQSLHTKPKLETLNQLLEIRQAISRGNVFPFRNQAVLAFTLLNILQVTLSARELLPDRTPKSPTSVNIGQKSTK